MKDQKQTKFCRKSSTKNVQTETNRVHSGWFFGWRSQTDKSALQLVRRQSLTLNFEWISFSSWQKFVSFIDFFLLKETVSIACQEAVNKDMVDTLTKVLYTVNFDIRFDARNQINGWYYDNYSLRSLWRSSQRSIKLTKLSSCMMRTYSDCILRG